MIITRIMFSFELVAAGFCIDPTCVVGKCLVKQKRILVCLKRGSLKQNEMSTSDKILSLGRETCESYRNIWPQFCGCKLKSSNKIDVTGRDSLVDITPSLGWTTYICLSSFRVFECLFCPFSCVWILFRDIVWYTCDAELQPHEWIICYCRK